MTRRLHMIGNAHIDPVWLWQWQEGYQEVRATFQSAVERLDAYPEFVFTCTSMVFLSWVEESDPAMFERIRARIAEGRWQLEDLARAIVRLTPEQRGPLVLRELQGCTYEEIAETLDLSISAVKSRLHRARLELVAAMRPWA